ncbi:adenosine 5'-monophosphoramidase HINT2-like isoform X1 [Galleria mellonella]|uniref:Adenosine 5'-monophosphoramidase HINT2-like isoform X1 n=1 Tax=Galleria mellonella TaxID=7137 RepID=A0A6J1WMW8_GALME|nr:adenosine 5'-monophosphoramidase HINT2-like isoform X1 [Galleria mellonella]
MAAIDIEQTKNPYFGGKSPPQYIFEDEQCIVFEADEDRQAPVHFIVVPKKVLPRLSVATEEDERLLGHILLVAKNLAVEKGLLNSGYHVMVDENYRTKKFIGLHVFGRALHHMVWPVGPGSRL